MEGIIGIFLTIFFSILPQKTPINNCLFSPFPLTNTLPFSDMKITSFYEGASCIRTQSVSSAVLG
jgi:hypothetical protein